jgi:hypothetical protein
MQLFTSDDPATCIGEAIGSVMVAGLVLAFLAVLTKAILLH